MKGEKRMQTMHEQIERIFKQVHGLLKTGTFTQNDIIFMHRFLAESLKMTRKLLKEAGIEEPS